MSRISKLNNLFLISFLLVVLFAVSVIAAVNLEAPAANLWTTSDNNTLEFKFNVSAADFATGVIECNLTLDDVVVATNSSVKNATATTLKSNTTFTQASHIWSVNCSNTTDVSNSAAQTFYYDITGPYATIEISNHTWYNTSTPAVSFNVSDLLDNPVNFTFFVDNSANTSGESANDTVNTTATLTGIADGAHTVLVQATDEVGNSTNSSLYTIYVDTAAPTVNLMTPVDNSNTSAGVLNFTFNMTEDINVGGPYNCSLYIDSTYNTSNASTQNDTTTVFLNIPLAEGTHIWNVSCTDNASNEGSALRSFTVDQTPPVPIIENLNHSWFNNATPTLDFNVTDPLSTPITYQFFVDGSPDSGATGNVANVTSSSANLADPLVNGTRTVILQAQDGAGNKANSSAWTIYVDTANPVVTAVTANNTNATTPTTLHYNVTENMGNPLNCTLFIDGGYNNTFNITVNNTEGSFLFVAADNSYTWYANCTDNASNSGVSTSLTVTLDNAGPVVNSITLNESDNFVSDNSANNNITLIVNATDSSTGVKYITANFNEISASTITDGIQLVNMTQIGSTDNWYVNVTINDSSSYEFEEKNITVTAYDYMDNPDDDAGQNYTSVVLYNMTLMPGDPQGCGHIVAGSTDFAIETNWNSIDILLLIDLNRTAACGFPAFIVDEQLHRAAAFNFTNMNVSSESAFNSLGQFMDSIDITINPDGQFGDSRIYLNSSALDDFNTSATMTLYGLPFDGEPALIEDVGSAGVNATAGTTYVTYTDANGYIVGNLTFTVKGFSGYNASDNTTPEITVNEPAPNATALGTATPEINLTLNGTGTQISNVTVLLEGTTYYTANMTCYNDTGSEEMNCYFNTNTLNDGTHQMTVTAWDYGGTAPGNNNSKVWNFTTDTLAPAVAGNSSNRTTIGGSMPVQINVTAVDATTNVSNVTVGKSGTFVQMTHIGANIYQANTTATALNCTTDGTCTLVFNATDYVNNSNSTLTMDITVDGGVPAVTSPNTNATNNRAKNSTILNITVTVNDTGGVSSVSVNGTDMAQLGASDVWSISTLNATSLGCAGDGECVLAFNATDIYDNSNTTTTLTLTLDDTAPTNTTAFSHGTPASTSATISATMNESAKCTVIYSTNSSNLSSSANSTTFSATLSVSLASLSASTTYHYNITDCWDDLGNSQNLNLGTFNFTTAAADGGGGGGSGGGGSYTTNYEIGDITGGESDWHLARGDSATFSHDGEEHTIMVVSVGLDHVKLEVTSTAQEVVINLGWSQDIDLDADGKKDINIKLLDITYNKALLRVKSLVTLAKDKIELLPPAKPKRREAPVEEVVEAAVEEEVAPAPPAPEATPVAEEAPPAEEIEEKMGIEKFWYIFGALIALVVIVIVIIIIVERGKRPKIPEPEKPLLKGS